jgi:hypothetical protein
MREGFGVVVVISRRDRKRDRLKLNTKIGYFPPLFSGLVGVENGVEG